MKKILLLAAAFTFTLAVSAQTNMPKPDEIAKFNEETHDFGKIKYNVPVIFYFEIKNITDKPIVVESATGSCGCTVPEKPEAPIEPGKTAKMKVQYAANAMGVQQKDVNVKLSGTDQMKTLHIRAEVVSAEEYDAMMKEKVNTPATPAKNEGTKDKPKN